MGGPCVLSSRAGLGLGSRSRHFVVVPSVVYSYMCWYCLGLIDKQQFVFTAKAYTVIHVAPPLVSLVCVVRRWCVT